ncbi:Peroxidase 60 -like protein [Gossypium arboreum]|uniref:Peroxidase n=1 Tax=Gossypium arboreum TaxID=29729 RepID=A0A0B0PAZ5_GOSAR|nr:peroxidase 60 [Gossypium arboreum]KHG23933.1 Peroxidase 60 -like protein [Gossypium arboreum]
MDIFISSAFGNSQKKKEKKMKISAAVVAAAFSLAFSFILVNFTGQCDAALQQGFYKGKCNSQDVEAIVASVVKRRFNDKPRVAAGLIRLFFHDCFVNGCDASILLDGDSSEKTAPPNLSVSGYDVIDEAKGLLEEACAGVVSCADIIAIAARDAVQLSGGGRYEVQTGRRDGFVSLASNVDLPSPRFSVSQSADAFSKKGIGLTDMVLLLGGHTIGFTNCSLFRDRLYNFDNTGKPDPTMDPLLVMKLRIICPQNSPADRTPVSLDQNLASTFIVDNSFYKQIRLGRGILQIDQALALDPLTNNTVASLANGNDFLARFGQAMVKLGAVDVLTDSQGEIRESCHLKNKPRSTFLFG